MSLTLHWPNVTIAAYAPRFLDPTKKARVSPFFPENSFFCVAFETFVASVAQ